MTSRFSDAWFIAQGACNPAGVARSLVSAIDQARADGVSPASDPAVKQIAYQLAFILRLSEYEGLDAYSRDYKTCEAVHLAGQQG